ncbi:MAG: TIGR00725 family protein [Anaerolineales bacterium]|nr:TIGR00725 family protein [Anaerolineales bacterium]
MTDKFRLPSSVFRQRAEMFIAVIGARKCDAKTYALAEEVGFELARRGAIIVCGGLGGVMEAACKGAKSAGGRTIGILPGKNYRDANPYVDVPIVTGLGEARNSIVVRTARAIIAVGGEYGTLSEIAFALKFGIPVIGLGTWQLDRGKKRARMIAARDAKEAVELAMSQLVIS